MFHCHLHKQDFLASVPTMEKENIYFPYQALAKMSFYLHFSITASQQFQVTLITPKPL